jgi:Flp pilus assembly pilin Flp
MGRLPQIDSILRQSGLRRDTEQVTRKMKELLRSIIQDDSGQDIAEYAIMLAVILIIVVGTVKLIGSNANSTFSNVASSLQ